MAEPRLLCLSPEYPDPEGNGGQVRIFQIYGRLARDMDVTVIAPGSAEGIARGASLANSGVDLRPVKRPASRAAEVFSAVFADPRIGAHLVTRSWLAWQAEVFLAEMSSRLEDALREPWSAVLIEHDWALRWALRVPAALPVGLTFHNLTDRLLAMQTASESGVLGLRSRRDAFLARREADRLAPRLSTAFACSKPEADEIGRRWGIDCAVVPNGADVQTPAGDGERSEVPGRIMFSGTMSYAPNAQAMRWFVDEVMELIRSRWPEATLAIVGREPSRDVLALGERPGVEVIGRVPDLRPWLEEAQVVVAPLLSGGGTKLKVIEAMAVGRPVVATSVGAEGIECADGQHLLVADGAEPFANAVGDLLGDRRRAERIAAHGKTLARELYSWDSAARTMREAIDRWLGAPVRG